MSKLNGILVVYSDSLSSSKRFYEEAKKQDIILSSYISDLNRYESWDFALFRKFDQNTQHICSRVNRQYNNFNRAHVLGSKINQDLYIDLGFPKPKTLYKRFGITYEEITDLLGSPFVAKADVSFGGTDVMLITNPYQFYNNFERFNIYQEYIRFSSGRDIRVYVIGGEVIGSIIRVNENDFRSNMKQGGVPIQCSLSQEDKDRCSKIYTKYGLDICGLDLLFNPDGGFMFCESNSSPGFDGVESEIGINIAGKIISHIKEDIRRH